MCVILIFILSIHYLQKYRSLRAQMWSLHKGMCARSLTEHLSVFREEISRMHMFLRENHLFVFIFQVTF